MRSLLLFILLFQISACSNVFYQPTRAKYFSPEQFKIPFSEISFTTEDGIDLKGWLLMPKKDVKVKGTIVQFHGNAENMSSHFRSMAWLTRRGFQVLSFSYRGYGPNEGEPTQKGLHLDALAALEMGVELNSEAKGEQLIAYGQSLGGAVLGHSFPQSKVKDKYDLVVLDSTFSSYPSIAFQKLKEHALTFLISPMAYLLVSSKVNSAPVLPQISPVPVLVVHGEKDLIVPLENGKEIYSLLKDPKFYWEIKNGGHINVFFQDPKNRDKFIQFLEALKNKKPLPKEIHRHQAREKNSKRV